ncbi:hypothetical protein Tco_1093387 [Tanacetum coccineum]|uniref:Uncharacterized protein n=1 Tax=Tanacetum coccineum TaxID=301880 RepID=A0ABQ5ICI7_9ASTR
MNSIPLAEWRNVFQPPGLSDLEKFYCFITEFDLENNSLVYDEGMTWFQEDEQVQEKQSDDTEVLIEEQEPTKLVEDQGSSEKGQPKVTTADTTLNTAGATISTAGETPVVSTAGRIVYSRRSAEKRKDRGKSILTETEPEKKSKKQLELERLRHE